MSTTAIDADAFRAVLGRFATGVTVVTTRDAEGRDHGMTVSAFSSLSLDPPLVLVSIAKAATMHPVLSAASHFAVNILSRDQEALSRRFASEKDERFDGVGYERGESGVALLQGTLATVECAVHARHDGGDHTIFVGQVVHGVVHEAEPLLYYRGGYARLSR